MSIRQYRPYRRARRGISGTRALILNATFSVALLLQIAYPLVHGGLLRGITIATVYAGALTMLLHSYLSFGGRYLITFLPVTFIYALTVEIIGSKSGWPFGTYSYSQTLGAQIAGVPAVVPFAWIMMAHPILIASRKVSKSWGFLYGGIGLMAWDLFLDPQMVNAGRWTWVVKGSHIPFQPEIPLSNAVGWLLTGIGLIALLNWALPNERRKEGANSAIPNLFLGWTWFAGVVGNLFFFDRPGVALIGGLALGIFLVPYLFTRLFGTPDKF